MGIAYVSFFVENPAYFQFLYSQSNIKIDLSLSIPDDQNYKPYIIYKNIVSKLLGQTHYSEEKQNDVIITIWAFIHGVTSLATMNNVNYDNDWREKVIDFIIVLDYANVLQYYWGGFMSADEAFDFGLRLRQLREDRGMSRLTLTKKLGVSKETIYSG